MQKAPSVRKLLNRKIQKSIASTFKRSCLRGDSIISSILTPYSREKDSKKTSVLSNLTIAAKFPTSAHLTRLLRAEVNRIKAPKLNKN